MSDESANDDVDVDDKVRALQAELSGSQRDLAGFAQVVSHDLRGPLSVMLGFASLIKEREVLPEGDAARGHLEEILRAGARIDAMITALLIYLRNTQAELCRELVPISELARKVWREIGKGREVAMRAVIQIERLPPVVADPALLETLLRNLLDNALRFADPYDPRVRFGKAGELPGDVFFVEDNGKGFDSEHRARLFLPFQNLSSGQRGAGVGLATCARIVDRHGGQIWAECEEGRGTRFFFTLSGPGPQVNS
jgi:signal transduction histidine kinase